MKTYRNKKKALHRLMHLTRHGYYVSVRNTGKKSEANFQKLIDTGIFDKWRKIASYKCMEPTFGSSIGSISSTRII